MILFNCVDWSKRCNVGLVLGIQFHQLINSCRNYRMVLINNKNRLKLQNKETKNTEIFIVNPQLTDRYDLFYTEIQNIYIDLRT